MKINALKTLALAAALSLTAALAAFAGDNDNNAASNNSTAADLKGQQRWWNSDSWEASHPAYQSDVARNKWDYACVWKEHDWRENTQASKRAENAKWNNKNRNDNTWHDTWNYSQNDTGWQTTW